MEISPYDETLFYTEQDNRILFRNNCKEKLFGKKTEELVKCIEFFTGITILDIDIYKKETFLKKYESKIKKAKNQTEINKLNQKLDENILSNENTIRKEFLENIVNENFDVLDECLYKDPIIIAFLKGKDLIKNRCCNFNHNHQPNDCDDDCDDDSFEYIDDDDNNDGCIIRECFTCICTENTCIDLYAVKHKKTNITFSLGSRCIERFSEELKNKLNDFIKYNEDIGNCSNCKIKLCKVDYKQHKCNYDPDFVKNNIPLCFDCFKSTLTSKVLKSFVDENDMNEIKKYIKHDWKCMNLECKIALWFKSTKYNSSNASTKNKDYCFDCIKEEELKQLKIKMNELIQKNIEKEKQLKLQQIENEKKRIEREEKNRILNIEREEKTRLLNIEREEKARLKKIEDEKKFLKNLKNIELKKQTIIRKFGCFENDRQYLNKCKNCEQEYNFIHSNNFINLCNYCFDKDI